MTDAPALAEFLLARIAADEADVKRRGTFAVGHAESCIFEGGYEGTSHCDCGSVARVLARCEADRRIVELHPRSLSLDYCETCFSGDFDFLGEREFESYPCPTLRALASVYADAPGFREEWR